MDEEYEKLKKYEQNKIAQQLMLSSRNEFIKIKWRQYYSLLWSHNPNLIETVKPMKLSELKMKIEELSSKRRSKYKNYFITLTTPPKTDKNKFIDGCKKLFNNAVIDRGYMVFEQRGETVDTVGDGLHCHLLVMREKYTHSKFSNRLLNQLIKLNINENYKSVKQLFKLANLSSSPFSFQNIKDETVEKKLAYIQGNKNDEKLLKVQFDTVFRKKFDLQEIYKKNI